MENGPGSCTDKLYCRFQCQPVSQSRIELDRAHRRTVEHIDFVLVIESRVARDLVDPDRGTANLPRGRGRERWIRARATAPEQIGRSRPTMTTQLSWWKSYRCHPTLKSNPTFAALNDFRLALELHVG